MLTRHCFAVMACVVSSLFMNGFCARPVYADDSTLTEQHYFPDLPVVLSATRLPQSVEDAPIAVTIITREMIEASGATEIPDLFRLVPGFLVDYDNAHVAAVSYHMLPDRYVRQQQVLIDGRSVYDPLIGGVPWMELPITIDDIERIEVIRGANAATYGSNSFLGVINIITRSAILDKGTAIKANIGSDKLREGFMRYGNSHGALDYRINLAYRSDDGFAGRNDGKIIRLLNSRFDYQLNDKDNMVMQAGYSAGPRQMDDRFDSGIPNHDMHTHSQFQQFKWQRVNAPEDEYSLQVYHNQLIENNTYTRTDYPVLWNEDAISERYDIEAQKIKRLNEKLRYVIGASYRFDQVKSPLYFGTTSPLDNRIRRIFTHGEYRYNKKVLLNLGVMLEDNDITGSDLSPRASLNLKLTPKDTMRLSVSKANRTPVLFEQYPNMSVNVPSLSYQDQIFYNGKKVSNEQITEYELGFIGHKLQNKFNYDVKFFYQDIKGLINALNATLPGTVTDTVDGKAYIFDNYDDAIIRGFETGIDWVPSNTTKFHLAFSHIYITSTDNREDYSKSAPTSLLSLLAMHNFKNGYSGSLFIYSRSKMKPLARHSYNPEYMDPYTRVDLRLANNFRIGDTSQKIALVIRNLFNAQQDSILLNNVEQGAYLTYQIGFN
jgi:iron complex outermembrane receptor protein